MGVCHLGMCFGAWAHYKLNPYQGNALKTHFTFAVAIIALASATSTFASEPNFDSDNAMPAANTLTTEAVVSDLVKFRQSGPSRQPPRDGEWYDMPALLGYTTPLRTTVNYDSSGPDAQTMPALLPTGKDHNPSQ